MPSVNDLPPPTSGIEDLPPPVTKDESPSYLKQAGRGVVDSLPMVGGMIGGLVGTPLDVVSGPMGTVGGAVIGGGLGESAKNLINAYLDPDRAPKSLTDAAKDTAGAGVEQGLMQGAGEIAAPYVSKAIGAASQYGSDAAKWAGKKLLSNVGGVNPSVISEYLQNADRINSAPGVEALKDVSDNYVGKLASDVDAKSSALDQAKGAYQNLNDTLKDQYQTARYDARDAVTNADQALKDAHGSRLQQLSGDINDAIKDLKTSVYKGSDDALGVLEKHPDDINIDPVISKIDSTIASLRKSNTNQSLSVAKELEAYKSRLPNSGDFDGIMNQRTAATIDPKDAKSLIKGIDKITDYNQSAGNFDTDRNAAFKGVRSVLDQTLKNSVPEYAKAMEPVAADASLLDNVSHFGDKQAAVGFLKRINDPGQFESRAALDQLGKKYGYDFVNGANPASLPEKAILDKALANQDALRPDLVSSKIDQTLASSREKAALDGAISDHAQAQQNLAPLKPLAPNSAGQTTAQQKLNQLGKGKNIELEEMFNKLGGLTNTDFSQAMKDQNTLAQFQKGATNGSRNTLMGSLAGYLFGGKEGLVAGGAAGRVVDQYGPAMTKKVLDAAIGISKKPSVEAISQLDIPAPLKKQMLVGYQNYLSQNPASPISQAIPKVAGNDSPNRLPATGEDKWAQDGISKLGIDPSQANQLLVSKASKALLIEASDLSPDSKRFQMIKKQLSQGMGS
jgi:hypothetical protein